MWGETLFSPPAKERGWLMCFRLIMQLKDMSWPPFCRLSHLSIFAGKWTRLKAWHLHVIMSAQWDPSYRLWAKAFLLRTSCWSLFSSNVTQMATEKAVRAFWRCYFRNKMKETFQLSPKFSSSFLHHCIHLLLSCLFAFQTNVKNHKVKSNTMLCSGNPDHVCLV